MDSGSRGKMVFGALLTLFGIWWYLPNSVLNSLLVPYSSVTNYQSLLIGVQGSIGILAILVGIFVVWIERDRLKVQRELQARETSEHPRGNVDPAAQEDGSADAENDGSSRSAADE